MEALSEIPHKENDSIKEIDDLLVDTTPNQEISVD